MNNNKAKTIAEAFHEFLSTMPTNFHYHNHLKQSYLLYCTRVASRFVPVRDKIIQQSSISHIKIIGVLKGIYYKPSRPKRLSGSEGGVDWSGWSGLPWSERGDSGGWFGSSSVSLSGGSSFSGVWICIGSWGGGSSCWYLGLFFSSTR